MRIQDSALIALSVALTASIVFFPDLPSEIPPLSRRENGVFLGSPLVAFLLPAAACTIWWVFARLNRPGGALTVLFLSLFHLTTLAALIGGQAWFGRVLGLLVGLYLVLTGNELPRRRDVVWKRVYRVSAYLRVVLGAAICAASLTGTRRLPELIAVAVGLEGAMYLVARLFVLGRKPAAVAGFLLAVLVAPAGAQHLAKEKIDALPAFLNAAIPRLMAERHVVGTAIAVVHDGRVIFTRGYGKSRLDTGDSVDPSRTAFRIGSLSKVFTGLAAVQLVESGKLDLHRDVREYLRDIPLRYGATTHQLLTHTAGLDERFGGSYTDSPAHLQTLADHLRYSLPAQVYRPGTASSYTNYGYALVGLLVERLSGLRYDQYMTERVFQPLEMTFTSAAQPPPTSLQANLARGYRWTRGQHEPLPFTFTQAPPAGSMVTTARDLERFMLALLTDGPLDEIRVLSPASLRIFLAEQYTDHPRIPGTAYGFGHMISHGQRLLVRGGTLGDQAALMILIPAHRLGIVVLSNALPGVGDFLFEPLLTHLAGPEPPVPPPIPLVDAKERTSRFAGTYRAYRQARGEMSWIRSLMPMMQRRVSVDADGTIQWQGRRWVEVEPLLFRQVDGREHMVFREDARGRIFGVGSFERIEWWQQTAFQLGILLSCLVAFLAFAASFAIRALRRREATQGRLARRCAFGVALANIAFIVGLVVFFRDFGAVVPLPVSILLWLWLPVLSLAATMLLPAFATVAWRDNWWTRGERVRYSGFAVFAVTFMTFINYWRLLGFHY